MPLAGGLPPLVFRPEKTSGRAIPRRGTRFVPLERVRRDNKTLLVFPTPLHLLVLGKTK